MALIDTMDLAGTQAVLLGPAHSRNYRADSESRSLKSHVSAPRLRAQANSFTHRRRKDTANRRACFTMAPVVACQSEIASLLASN